MNYLTKQVLSKISTYDLYSFITKDCKIFHSVKYDIGYRISGSFFFMYKKRRSDSSVVSFHVFHKSDSTIQGFLTPLDTHDNNNKTDKMVFSSKHFTSQCINASLLDEEYVLNCMPYSDSIDIRCSAVASSLSITYNKISKLLISGESGEIANKAAFNKCSSYILPFGKINASRGLTDIRRERKIYDSYMICSKILSVKKEGFKIGNASFGPWQIFKIATPFLGTMDILLSDGNISYNPSLVPYGVFTVNETLLDSLPLYSDSYKKNFPSYAKIIDDTISQKNDGTAFKGLLKKNVSMYFNGVLTGKGNETVYSIIMTIRGTLMDNVISNRTLIGKIKDICGTTKDVTDFLINEKVRGKFTAFLKSLQRNYSKYNVDREDELFIKNKFAPDYYKKFIGTDVVMVVSSATHKVISCIFAQKAQDGLINEIHITSLPIFDIDTIENPISPPVNTALYSLKLDTNRNIQTSKVISSEILFNYMPLRMYDKMRSLLMFMQKHNFLFFDILISSLIIYLKKYLVHDEKDFTQLSFNLSCVIFESLKMTDAVMHPFYDMLTYMALFIPELMYEHGKTLGKNGMKNNMPKVSELANRIKEKVLSHPGQILRPFADNPELRSCLYEMTKFIPTNDERYIKTMKNIALVFLIYGFCEEHK